GRGAASHGLRFFEERPVSRTVARDRTECKKPSSFNCLENFMALRPSACPVLLPRRLGILRGVDRFAEEEKRRRDDETSRPTSLQASRLDSLRGHALRGDSRRRHLEGC